MSKPVPSTPGTSSPGSGPNASERAYEFIRARIASGELGNGERIVETEVAACAGVSRTPVRAALQRLATEGFVEISRNHGATVRGYEESEVAEIFDVRLLLEGRAAALAALRARTGEIDEMEAICARMEELLQSFESDPETNYEVLAPLNNRFHVLLLEAARHRTLKRMVTGLIELHFAMHSYARFTTEDIRRSILEHRKLVDAIRARDTETAEALMRLHILSARRNFLPT